VSITTNDIHSARVPEGVPSVIQHYIGGKHVDSLDGGVLDVLDPVDHSAYATVASGKAADVDAAVAAARDAFENSGWADMPSRKRSDALRAIAAEIEKRNDVISSYEAFDTGLPVTQAKGQAARAAENFKYFADVCATMHEDAFRTKAQLGYVIRRPRGVAGLITPWNVPFMLATWKIAPALASGCTVVL
jgi:5-carboxymethyl-2-hydroxymuconic-semialdehyde dehydrogenase